MQFIPHASSSAGNCYEVRSGDTTLLLEAGLSLRAIRQALAFRLSGVAGVCITHEHQDHAKAAGALMTAGVDVYTSAGTAGALGLTGHRLHTVKAREQFRVGGLTVLPFEAQHDAAEPLGFLVADGADKLLFATDTAYLRWRFRGLTLIAVEANFAEDLCGDLDAARFRRLVHSHMSLASVKALLAANDLGAVREIHLLHLSGGHSDLERFRREIEAATGRPVYVAEK